MLLAWVRWIYKNIMMDILLLAKKPKKHKCTCSNYSTSTCNRVRFFRMTQCCNMYSAGPKRTHVRAAHQRLETSQQEGSIADKTSAIDRFHDIIIIIIIIIKAKSDQSSIDPSIHPTGSIPQ
jgi:hypothetical protein